MTTDAITTGTKIRTTKPMRFLAPDFPGWGADNYADFFLDLPAGVEATVTSIESHGSNPWTRYCIRTADGARTMGVFPAHVERV